MEILSSRVLLRPRDLERSITFYRDTIGLHVFREWGSGDTHGVVFFLGGGYLEVSGTRGDAPGEKLCLWLQVRDVDAVRANLGARGVTILEEPSDKPWKLREMRAADPDGVVLYFIQVPEDHPLRRRPE